VEKHDKKLAAFLGVPEEGNVTFNEKRPFKGKETEIDLLGVQTFFWAYQARP